MNKPSEMDQAQGDAEATLDEVLEAYITSERYPSGDLLREWVRRYPKHEQELITLTARWSLLAHLPDVQEEDEVDEATLIRRGMSVGQTVLHFANRAAHAETDLPAPLRSGSKPRSRQEGTGGLARIVSPPLSPVRGLLVEGSQQGMTADMLAAEIGISVSLLAKMDRRVIKGDTIPRIVSARVAVGLKRDLPAILHYSRLEPRFASGAEHRANQAPVLPRHLESFFDAVRTDRELTDEQRRALLALEGADDSGG